MPTVQPSPTRRLADDDLRRLSQFKSLWDIVGPCKLAGRKVKSAYVYSVYRRCGNGDYNLVQKLGSRRAALDLYQSLPDGGYVRMEHAIDATCIGELGRHPELLPLVHALLTALAALPERDVAAWVAQQKRIDGRVLTVAVFTSERDKLLAQLAALLPAVCLPEESWLV